MPLIRRGLLAGAALVFLNAMKELPATLLLRPIGFETLATEIWKYTALGSYSRAAPPALLLILRLRAVRLPARREARVRRVGARVELAAVAPQGHSVDEYLETIYFLAFPIGEYRPMAEGLPTVAVRVAEMLGVSRASAGRDAQAARGGGADRARRAQGGAADEDRDARAPRRSCASTA